VVGRSGLFRRFSRGGRVPNISADARQQAIPLEAPRSAWCRVAPVCSMPDQLPFGTRVGDKTPDAFKVASRGRASLRDAAIAAD
jgi:hypothetical protein